MREEAAAKSDEHDAATEQRRRLGGRGEDHRTEGDNADHRANTGDAMRIGATREPSRGNGEPCPAAKSEHRRESGRRAHREMQHAAAIGLE